MEKKEIHPIDMSDAKRFRIEYERFFPGLKYFAVSYVRQEEIACDLLQDVFVDLWERANVYENEQAFKVYLYKAVRNKCLTFLRDTRRKEHRMSAYEPEETEESFVCKIIESEQYAMINKIFEQLPAASKKVYIKSLEGKTHKEISDELHIAVNTIKRHKNIANHYLKERLKGLWSVVLLLQ